LIRPPAMAVAILPEPIKPILKVDILILSVTITFYTDLSFCLVTSNERDVTHCVGDQTSTD
jgi:hypothetical protein